jgi:hypothetical protein
MGQIDRVLGDVALFHQAGEDVDHAVGHQQRAVVARDVHDEDMAGPAAAAQTGFARHGRAQQIVAVQAALHQGPGLAIAAQLRPGPQRCGVVRRGVDLGGRQVQTGRASRGLDALLRPYQQRLDQAGLRRLHGRLHRAGIAGVGHGHGNRAAGLAWSSRARRGGRIVGGHGKGEWGVMKAPAGSTGPARATQGVWESAFEGLALYPGA